MRQWFESLPGRDQIALMALVAALGLWLFVQLIFIELDGRRDRLTEGNQALAEKLIRVDLKVEQLACLLYTSPSPRDKRQSRMPSSA